MNKVKGTKDYFDSEIDSFAKARETLFKIANNFAFSEVITPILEHEELFKRFLGLETDIITKEMYRLNDKKNRALVLRPEGTAPISRMVLENKLLKQNQTKRLFYFGPMFRYERPQKGRQREFYQFGVELFNDKTIFSNLLIIQFCQTILQEFAITKFKLQLNSLGSLATRKQYLVVLKKYYEDNKTKLSSDSQERIEKNVLRILDSKLIEDKKINLKAPKISQYWSEDEKSAFNQTIELLQACKIDYEINYQLVRGLDYYNDFIFEFISTDTKNLGASATLIAGGRYDGLINQLDKNEHAYAIGFALGVERLLLASAKEFKKPTLKIGDYYIIPLNNEYNLIAAKIFDQLRKMDYKIFINYDDQKLAKKISQAAKHNYTNVIIVGEETNNNNVIIKNLITRKQEEIEINKIGT